jgi:hypothetical protein
MLKYEKFYDAIQALKKFMEEQDKLDAALKIISPSGTSVCEFGNEFIDDYIKLLEESVGDRENWIAWYVFENEFGKKGLEAKMPNGETKKIRSEKQLYDFFITNHW